MSVRQMSMVWDLDLAPNKRLVLLAYADPADDDGDNVFPSLGRVAHKTGYSADQVRRLSRELVADGLMELAEKGVGRGNTHRYRLTLEKGSKLPAFKPKQAPAQKVAESQEKVASRPEKVAPMPPEPSEPPSLEPSSSPRGSYKPTKDRITLLVDRCREMDFEPTPKQKLTWGNELNAKSRLELQGREFMRLVNLIARAGSDGYFWSFSRAERELGKPGAKSAIGITPAEDPNVSEEEKSSPYDLGAYLDRKRRAS